MSANPELASSGLDQLIIYDQAAAQRRREAWARQMEIVRAQQAAHWGPRSIAGRAEAERGFEDAMIAGDPQRDLAVAQHHRAAAQQDITRITGLLGRARDLAREIGRQAAHTELIVAEAKQAAVDEVILQLAEGADPTIRALPSGHDDRRLAVATEAVERLEGELAAAQARFDDCQRLCRKHAGEVMVLDAIAMAREIEEFEAAIAEKRAGLAALVAVLTDARRAATGSGHGLALPSRIQRVLVDHADRLLATLDRAPWLERFTELVAGEAGDVRLLSTNLRA